MLLRTEKLTVNDLASALRLTDNAVRSHLSSLERDGLVQRRGRRRGRRRPHVTYGLSAEADHIFPKAYGPVLQQLLEVLSERMLPDEVETLLGEVGRRIATRWNVPQGDLRIRLEAAVERLRDAVARLSIASDRPRPGRIHVASFRAGGFSGRRHTFLLGLDETRVPGDRSALLRPDDRQHNDRAVDLRPTGVNAIWAVRAPKLQPEDAAVEEGCHYLARVDPDFRLILYWTILFFCVWSRKRVLSCHPVLRRMACRN